MLPPKFNPDWPEDVKSLYEHDRQEMWDRSIAPHIWSLYHDQLDRFIELAGPAPLRIMDVGCAQGTLALLLAERGHQVVAVDIRPQFLDYARSRHAHGQVDFVVANVLEDELPRGFDLIFANQLIEHLVYPERLLGKLLASLEPRGRIVVTTPHGGYLRNSLPSFRELGDPADWEHMQFSADGDGHFFAYRVDELEAVFRASGLVEIRHELIETPFINGHMKLRHLHRMLPHSLLRAADRALLSLPMLGRAFSHQLMVVGTKPEGDRAGMV